MRARQAAHTQEQGLDGPDERRIRIVIADDQPATRMGLRLLLEREGFTVCAEAAACQVDAHVLLADLGDLEACRNLAERAWNEFEKSIHDEEGRQRLRIVA